MEETKKIVDTIVKGIQEKKGQGITVIDLSNIEGAIAHYFVICQGNTPTQVEAIADSVEDYTDVIVHIFVPEMRNYYNIENLWQDATITEIPDVE